MGKRIFPPTVDEHGNVTYYYEFPEDWRPWEINYVGHGWIFATQVLLWLGVATTLHKSDQYAEKPRD
jgi:hypothetical protein